MKSSDEFGFRRDEHWAFTLVKLICVRTGASSYVRPCTLTHKAAQIVA
jgi:hypothetical protein